MVPVNMTRWITQQTTVTVKLGTIIFGLLCWTVIIKSYMSTIYEWYMFLQLCSIQHKTKWHWSWSKSIENHRIDSTKNKHLKFRHTLSVFTEQNDNFSGQYFSQMICNEWKIWEPIGTPTSGFTMNCNEKYVLYDDVCHLV